MFCSSSDEPKRERMNNLRYSQVVLTPQNFTVLLHVNFQTLFKVLVTEENTIHPHPPPENTSTNTSDLRKIIENISHDNKHKRVTLAPGNPMPVSPGGPEAPSGPLSPCGK